MEITRTIIIIIMIKNTDDYDLNENGDDENNTIIYIII